MTLPRLILDTSACSHIATSPHRKDIEAHLDREFRRAMSVQTFWELLQQIEGGDGSHFSDDKEVFKVAAGTNRDLLMLPNPLSHAVETVLKWPRPTGPLPPSVFKQTYATIMKARTRAELYNGVRVVPGLKQVRLFAPEVVRRSQAEGEQAHIGRLKSMKRRKVSALPPYEWARAMIKNNLQKLLDNEEAAELGKSLDAAYQFEMEVLRAATAQGSNYNPEKHGNDWTDMQQTMYLCDPAIHLMTADAKLVTKIAASHQANRVLLLPDYLRAARLSL
jgi:hypothetical protein